MSLLSAFPAGGGSRGTLCLTTSSEGKLDYSNKTARIQANGAGVLYAYSTCSFAFGYENGYVDGKQVVGSGSAKLSLRQFLMTYTMGNPASMGFYSWEIPFGKSIDLTLDYEAGHDDVFEYSYSLYMYE